VRSHFDNRVLIDQLAGHYQDHIPELGQTASRRLS
jgi:hypothetical protein